MMLEKLLAELGVLKFYSNHVFRIVETQEYAATTELVDDLDEQALLEQLLDDVKPPYKPETEHLHYLISTPFRYPPLKYGSRFGRRDMPSYFYASETINTALSECAFYRLKFMHDMSVAYEHNVNSEHQSFSVKVATQALADLTGIDNQHICQALTSKTDYRFSQSVGKHLTQNLNTEVIRCYSARAEQGVNLVIAKPQVIKSKVPENMCNWICQTNMSKVSFNRQAHESMSLQISDLLVEEQLPSLS
jgi:hypothetical protein